MTGEEKNAAARFLDLVSDYLGDGHRRSQKDYSFEDDSPESPGEKKEIEAPGLPLAYTVEEYGGEEEENRPGENEDSIEKIAADVRVCDGCPLAATRTLAVPGEGVNPPLVMVVGEGPGADEDRAGRPFVGRAGQLLDRMLESIGLYRNKNCFIANMVKCRPPGNRDPQPDEIAACSGFLERQITLLGPKLIVCAGRVAAQNLLKTSRGINSLRGEFIELKFGEKTVPVLPTFHPSALLRDEALKRPAWEDLKLLRARLISLDTEYARTAGGDAGET